MRRQDVARSSTASLTASFLARDALTTQKRKRGPRSRSADLRLLATPKPHPDPEACTSFSTPPISGFVEPHAWKPLWQHLLGHTKPSKTWHSTFTLQKFFRFRAVTWPIPYQAGRHSELSGKALPSMSSIFLVSDFFIHRLNDGS